MVNVKVGSSRGVRATVTDWSQRAAEGIADVQAAAAAQVVVIQNAAAARVAVIQAAAADKLAEIQAYVVSNRGVPNGLAGLDADGSVVDAGGTKIFNANLAPYAKTADLSPYAKTADYATVSRTGAYADLTGKPTIPAPFDPTDILNRLAALEAGGGGGTPTPTALYPSDTTYPSSTLYPIGA